MENQDLELFLEKAKDAVEDYLTPSFAIVEILLDLLESGAMPYSSPPCVKISPLHSLRCLSNDLEHADEKIADMIKKAMTARDRLTARNQETT